LNCLTFVEIHGQISCDVNELEKLVRDADQNKKPLIFHFDKHYTASSPKAENELQQREAQKKQPIVVILYTQIGSAQFSLFNKRIVELEKSHPIDYVLRHNYEEDNLNGKVVLSGYGVELDIKSTEYKAKDDTKVNEAEEDIKTQTPKPDGSSAGDEEATQGFMFNRLKQLNPDLVDKLNEFRKYLLESQLELAPLKAWQMQDLSLQAAQRLLESDPAKDSLDILEDISQNYPTRARILSKIQVKTDLKKQLKSHRQTFESLFNMEAGSSALYLNGLELSIDTTDIFTLNSLLRKEAKLVESLHQIGLDLTQINDLIYLDTSSKNMDYGIDIRDSSIQWLNDLESDSKYSYWSRNVQEILRPTYPGMMRSIGKNFYNLVLVLDPSREEAKSLLKTAESFYVNDVPVRLGVFILHPTNIIEKFRVSFLILNTFILKASYL
jgi:UDP-glucose:glycoprotein glucosyltransferase